jgi:hypothetical protein
MVRLAGINEKIAQSALVTTKRKSWRHFEVVPSDYQLKNMAAVTDTIDAARGILFAIDFSECSNYALEWGLRNMGLHEGDTVTLVTVNVRPESLGSSFARQYDEVDVEQRSYRDLQVSTPCSVLETWQRRDTLQEGGRSRPGQKKKVKRRGGGGGLWRLAGGETESGESEKCCRKDGK